MSNKARTKIAVLATALFLGAMSAAGASMHGHATAVAAVNHVRPAGISAPQANPLPDSKPMTHD